VALITPFNDDFSIDYAALKGLIEYTTENGADYLVVHGTTGEPATTTLEEKISILEFVKANNAKNLPIVLGFGGNNTAELIQLFSAFDFNGIDAILSVGPYYNKPSQEGYFRHYSEIADKSPVPVILYNVPGRTGSNINSSTVARLSQHRNIIGIKEASGDLVQCMEILKNSRAGFVLIGGDDLLTLPMISFGAIGSISVLANLYPKIYSEAIHLALDNKFAEGFEKLKLLIDLNPLLYKEGNPVGAKVVLSEKKLIKNNLRLPLFKASAALEAEIKDVIKKI
jgi:4-hydroxy-tetrahydrodipicolinate synthase